MSIPSAGSISTPARVAHSPAFAWKREGGRERAIAITIATRVAIAISVVIVFGYQKTTKTPHLSPQIVRPTAASSLGSRAYVARELGHGPQMNSYYRYRYRFSALGRARDEHDVPLAIVNYVPRRGREKAAVTRMWRFRVRFRPVLDSTDLHSKICIP
jgi:hypothetical protein